MDEVKLLPCPFCGLHLREDGPEWHHEIADCPLSDSVFDEQQVAEWNARAPTLVTDELVERVARALAIADGKDPDAPAWVQGYGDRAQTFGICWRDQYETKARAAIAAMPTIPPQSLGDDI